MNSPNYILEESNFDFRYIRLCDLHILREKWLNYLQTVETDLGLHCLPVTLFGVSRLQWVKYVLVQKQQTFASEYTLYLDLCALGNCMFYGLFLAIT